jgi:hypothetical protein
VKLDLPLGAWIFLGVVLLIFVVSNISLLAALAQKNHPKHKHKPQKTPLPSFTRPWKEEDDHFAELSRKVKELKEQERKDNKD